MPNSGNYKRLSVVNKKLTINNGEIISKRKCKIIRHILGLAGGQQKWRTNTKIQARNTISTTSFLFFPRFPLPSHQITRTVLYLRQHPLLSLYVLFEMRYCTTVSQSICAVESKLFSVLPPNSISN